MTAATAGRPSGRSADSSTPALLPHPTHQTRSDS